MGDYLVQIRRVICGILCTAICLCLFVPQYKVSAETTAPNFVGYYVYKEILDDVEMVDQLVNSNGTTTYTYRYWTHFEYDAFSNDPTGYGTITINGTSVRWSGTYSHGTAGGNTGTFTDYENSQNLTPSNISLTKGTGTLSLQGTTQEIVKLDSTQVTSILNAINSIDVDAYDDTQLLAYLSSIESILNTVNTDLLNIAWQLDVNNQYSFAQSVSGLLGTMSSRLLTISNASTSINSYLLNVLDTKLQTINTAISVTNSRLLTINNTIADGFTHLEENIDSIIDTISWKDADVTFYGVSTTYDGTYSTDSIISNVSDIYFKFKSNTSQPPGYIYKIICGIYNNNFNIGNNGVYLSEIFVNGTNVLDNPSKYVGEYYISRTSGYPTLYIPMYAYGNNDDRVVILHFTRYRSSGTYLRFNSSQVSFSFISELDIEYWKLLDSITLQLWFSLYKEDQTSTSQNIVNATQQLTQQNNQLVAFEDQFTNNMNQSLNDINLNLDLEGGLSDFNSTLSYFTTVNDTVMQIPYIKYSILLILVFCLIGLIL